MLLPKRRAILLSMASSLAACTSFRPLHMPGGEADLNLQLAAISINEAKSRTLQTLRNELIDRLNPSGANVIPEYKLRLGLSRKRKSLAVQLDDRITRYDMTLRATAVLSSLATEETVYRTAVARTASYNVVREPFATLVAEQDAERRASIEIANQLRALLALYFEKAARSDVS